MGENAELWTRLDDNSIRSALCSWLIRHGVEFDEDMNIEELRQLYIKKECGRI